MGVTSKGGWVVAAQALEGNPYDGHTLQSTMDQLVSMTGKEPEYVYADMNYRGHDYQGECKVHVDSRKRGGVAVSVWRWIKRRAAIEHLKEERRMERNRLGGTGGDKINAVLSAAGMNFSKLLSALGAFWSSLLVRLAAYLGPRSPDRALAAAGRVGLFQYRLTKYLQVNTEPPQLPAGAKRAARPPSAPLRCRRTGAASENP